MRIFVIRPELNRFIFANRYWQRNELSMNFVVKENFTDEAPETSNPLVFRKDMTLMEYSKVIDDYINNARKVSENSNFTDDTIDLFMHFPAWLVAGVVKMLGFMDRLGKAPKFLREADGLHTSAFVANLGSIGITGGSPLHHLYEWGTTSVFVTLGMMERKREFDDDGKVISSKETVQIGVTVDERITSGFYFIKSMAMFQDLMNHPEELEKVPVIPQDTPTKKEYKTQLKAERKERKLKKKQLKLEAENQRKSK